MKKYIFLLLLLLPALLPAQAPLRIGYTNIEVILAYMPESKTIESELKTLENKLMEALIVKQRYFESKMQEYQDCKERNTCPPEELKQREDELRKLQQEISTAADQADQTMLQRRAALMQPLTEKIQKAIDAVAAEGQYTYILNNTAGGGVPTILYGLESEEVTEKIATKLGIKIPTAAPAPGN